MIITHGSTPIEVGLRSYSVDWSSGIDWKSVGGFWKPLDRGEATAKWSSSVTVIGSPYDVKRLRSMVLYAARLGDTILVQCEGHEQIFGPEMFYLFGYACLVGNDESPIVVDTDSNGVLHSWTFTVHPTVDMVTRYRYPTATLPASGLMVQGVEWTGHESHRFLELETARASSGLQYETPTVEVTYLADSFTAANAITFFQRLRTAQCLMTIPNGDDTAEENYFVLNMEHDGARDMCGEYHSFVVIFGKVQ